MNMALDMLFRPLARLAIARGLRFADVSDRLRRAFLSEAQRLSGENAAVSKLSVLTGLQRRDVSKLLETSERADDKQPDQMSRLVAQWHILHKAAPLPHHGPTGSFDALARSIRQDIHPRSMLDVLVASETVEIRDGFVHLLKSGYVPLEGSDAQILYLGQNVGDHLAVAVGNVLGDKAAFELAVNYNHLSTDSVDKLETLWRERMKSVLNEVNDKANEYQNQETGHMKFRAGGYFRMETEK